MTKKFWDTTYFWVMIVSLKDLFLVISPAIVTDGVDSLSLCGFMYVGYSVLTMVALPYTDNSSNVIDAILSFIISLQKLLATSLGFADGPCTNADARSDSKVAARASWILVVSARRLCPLACSASLGRGKRVNWRGLGRSEFGARGSRRWRLFLFSF